MQEENVKSKRSHDAANVVVLAAESNSWLCWVNRLTRRVLLINCLAFAANFAVVAIVEHYDLRLDGLHFVAHGCAKPLLLMNGAFLLLCLATMSEKAEILTVLKPDMPSDVTCRWLFVPSVILLALFAHWQSLTINFSHHDWNHVHISSSIHSLANIWRLFSGPQADGFYRPMTFLSLWFDYAFFRNVDIAYHLDSLVIHVVNAMLVGCLARQLGFTIAVARWASGTFRLLPSFV
jgi:hypothetical protein